MVWPERRVLSVLVPIATLLGRVGFHRLQHLPESHSCIPHSEPCAQGICHLGSEPSGKSCLLATQFVSPGALEYI